MRLTVNREVGDDAVVVKIAGAVDVVVSEGFSSHLKTGLKLASRHPSPVLIVDLQDVALFGSAGLNALLDCHQEGTAAGIAVRVVATTPVVVRPIEVTKLDAVLDLYPTVNKALKRRDRTQQP